MAIKVQDGFRVETALPADDRFVFADLTARDALNPLYRYEGLTTYVTSEETFYSLVGGITNGDWVENAGGGGAGVVQVADDTERDDIDPGDRTEGMLVYVVATAKTYQLKGGITNADWVEFGTGGGITVVTDIAARNAIPSGDRFVGMYVHVINGTQPLLYFLFGGITDADWRVFPGRPHVPTGVTGQAAGGTLSLFQDHYNFVFRVAGTGGPQTMSTTPFNMSSGLDHIPPGTRVTVIGNDDDNPVTIPANDASRGCMPYDVTLGKYQSVTYIWHRVLERFIIESTNV